MSIDDLPVVSEAEKVQLADAEGNPITVSLVSLEMRVVVDAASQVLAAFDPFINCWEKNPEYRGSLDGEQLYEYLKVAVEALYSKGEA